MKDNLKNCPFCDGEGKLETMLYGGTAVSCQNTDCGFYGYNVETSMWNTRPNDAKWISVEDELPEDELNVLCYIPSVGGYVSAWLGKNDEDGWSWIAMDDTWDYDFEDVTHWMPLPTPPKQSSEGE